MKTKTPLKECTIELPPHVRHEDLGKLFYYKDKKKFLKWMFGQTIMLLDGKPCYYIWDVERFISGLPCID